MSMLDARGSNLNMTAQPTSSLPALPKNGALVKVCFAGACTGEGRTRRSTYPSLPGYEIAGVLQSMSKNMPNSNYNIGDNVIIFPDEKQSKTGISDFIAVDNAENLVQIPKNMSLEVASMLPGAALTAYSAVVKALSTIENKLKLTSCVNVLIVGAGGQGLWTVQVARWLMKNFDSNRLHITVADGNIERLLCAREYGCYEVIHWNEEDHEQYIVERTQDACRGGGIDVCIDYVGSQRTVNRVMKVLNKDGLIMFGGEELGDVSVNLRSLSDKQQSIVGIPKGTHEQLVELVKAVSMNKLTPPCYTVYNVADADRAYDDLKQSRIIGRAILRMNTASNTFSSNINFNSSGDFASIGVFNDNYIRADMDVSED